MTRYIFRNSGNAWRVADENGIGPGARSILGELRLLDFDTAIDLAHYYRDQAEALFNRGYAVAEDPWTSWAEELEIWAARRRSAPGCIVIRRHAIHDDAPPTFAEMVGHANAGGGK